MQEKDILLDLLGGTKHSINCYTNAIMEGSNQQLRTTFQTLRDEAEQMQHQLYQMAEQKGYYHAAPGANQNDIQHIKNSLSNNMNGNTNPNANMNYGGGGQTNQNISQNQSQNQNLMSDTNSNPMINSNMMNTTNATSSISSGTANQHKSNTKKSKKK